MSLFDGKTKSERNKMIAAMALGALAILSLAYMLFGSSSGPKTPQQQGKKQATNSSIQTISNRQNTPQAEPSPLEIPQPIPVGYKPPEVPEAERNIFAFYVPPPPPTPTPFITPPPSPVPTPPILVSGVAPSNVYARTGDFVLQVSGDKFPMSSHITIDGRQMPTQYVNPQQLSSTVPASMIANEGARQVGVRTPDGKIFSNTATLNVTAPPAPNYSFIGALIGKRSNDVALLQDKATKEVFNAQRGDVLGSRFRLTSISAREVWFVDTILHVKHTVPFTGGAATDLGNRVPARRVDNDDEP